jgi:hypothetical protein
VVETPFSRSHGRDAKRDVQHTEPDNASYQGEQANYDEDHSKRGSAGKQN